MTEPTLANVQVLLDRPAGDGMIVSCYVDTSLAGYRSTWWQRLKNEIAQVDARLVDPDARDAFAADIATIRRALESDGVSTARGVAMFSAARHDFFQAFAIGVPVRDALVLDEQPYLVPLLEALHRQRRYLVVLTDTHEGRLYEVAWGHAHVIEEVHGDVPKRQRSAGETWGKQQATIARHREDRMLHYRKDLLARIEKAWGEAAFRGIVLLGEHEVLEHLRAELPRPLADRVVDERPHSWKGRQPSIESTVQAVLDAALIAHDRRLVDELERRLREHQYCVAAGPQEVLDALRNGQVGYPGYLVLQPDAGAIASRCTGCGAISADRRTTCTICGQACETVNLWQEILLFAARHEVPAHFVERSEALERHGGVAAMLSREGPWEPVAAGVHVERRIRP